MKKISLTLFSLAIALSAFSQELALKTPAANVLTPGGASFKWSATEFDFGKIKVGVPATHEFTFTNSGDSPLIISTVQASCGCTVTAYSKEPIEPGASGFVTATYNAAKVGQFNKTVTVNSNTEQGLVQLTIKGEVVAKETTE